MFRGNLVTKPVDVHPENETPNLSNNQSARQLPSIHQYNANIDFLHSKRGESRMN